MFVVVAYCGESRGWTLSEARMTQCGTLVLLQEHRIERFGFSGLQFSTILFLYERVKRQGWSKAAATGETGSFSMTGVRVELVLLEYLGGPQARELLSAYSQGIAEWYYERSGQ